jgi:flagellar assembly protein FliH
MNVQMTPRALSLPHRTVPSALANPSPAVNTNQEDVHTQAFSKGWAEGREAGLCQGLADAQVQLEKTIDKAVQEAVQKLESHAAAQAQTQAAEHAARLRRLDELMRDVQEAMLQRFDQLEIEATALAHEAVCKLIGATFVQAPAIAQIIQHAIAQWRGGTLLRVRLNARDLQSLSEHPAGQALMSRHLGVQWVADPKADFAGCVLDTDQGTLDARLDTQLAQLRALWVSTARQEQGAPAPHSADGP